MLGKRGPQRGRLALRERALVDGSCLTSNVTLARRWIASGGWEGEGRHEFSRQARVVEPGSPALRRGPARTEVGDPRRVPGVHWLRAEVRDPAAAQAGLTVGPDSSATGASVRTGRAGGAADCLVSGQWDLREAPSPVPARAGPGIGAAWPSGPHRRRPPVAAGGQPRHGGSAPAADPPAARA